jgi:O-antigen ligase
MRPLLTGASRHTPVPGLRGAPAAAPVNWVYDVQFRGLAALMVAMTLVLMTVPEGFDYAALAKAGPPAEGSLASRLAWLSLLAISGWIIVWRAGIAWLLMRWVNPFFLMFVGLSLASVAWSLYPGISFRRWMRVLTFLMVAVAFTIVSWHERRFQNVVRTIITMLLFGSLVFGIVRPELAIHHETSPELANAWHGLASHKNGLGAMASLGVILWAHAFLAHEERGLKMWLGLALSGACLVLSKSSTSLLTSILVIGFLLLLLRAPPALSTLRPYLIGGFSAVLLVYVLMLLGVLPGVDALLSPVSSAFGKDTSFSGRTGIWQIIRAQIAQHPVKGIGYGGYWVGPEPWSPAYEMVQRLNFYPGQAHNGYLEVLNDLGIVGMLVLIGYLAAYIFQCLALLRVDRDQAALFLGLFLQQSITNLSESRWLNAFMFDFALMTLATIAIARALLEARLRYLFGAPTMQQIAGAAASQARAAHPDAGLRSNRWLRRD